MHLLLCDPPATATGPPATTCRYDGLTRARLGTTLVVACAALAVLAPGALAAVSFSGPTDFTVGDSPYSIAVGDFNGDLDPDLAVANINSDTVSVLLGDGGGSFSGPTDFTVGNHPSSVAVGDFNGDLDPDLAVTNSSSGTVSVLLGDAGGSFGAATDFTVGSIPTSVAVGNFNGDLNPDLAVANFSSNTVSVLLNTAPTLKFEGFLQPLSNPPALNPARVDVPVIMGFRLTRADGSPVTQLPLARVRTQSLNCVSLTPGGDTPVTEAASFVYLGAGRWTATWTPVHAYRNTCRVADMNVGDGVSHPAYFRIR